MLANSSHETFVIEKIVSKKTRKDGTRMYKVKYKGQKAEKDYNDEKDLRDKGFGDYIDAYEASQPENYINMKVKKQFNDGKFYNGIIKKYNKKNKWFKIEYSDGDEEDLNLDELKKVLVNR